MAFLDNSGDIILDAVLTELGRQRMSEAGGNTTIVKFGLGDDEINYGTYDLAHPSGSAYYDLEIMQTPIFQATTATNIKKANPRTTKTTTRTARTTPVLVSSPSGTMIDRLRARSRSQENQEKLS